MCISYNRLLPIYMKGSSCAAVLNYIRFYPPMITSKWIHHTLVVTLRTIGSYGPSEALPACIARKGAAIPVGILSDPVSINS